MPLLDSHLYYKETAYHGIEIEVVPSLEFEINNKLIELTKSGYDEVLESVSKFLPELDSDLLREIDSYINKNLSDKEIKELKV